VEYPETTFGGDFETETDYLDPYMVELMTEGKNKVYFPPNKHSYQSINFDIDGPVPSPPTKDNIMGTDDRGRDVFARLLYGFRLSVLFGFALTVVGTFIGIIAGAVQGYFGGRTDLFFQRFIEIWGAMPELYLLIIFASIFKPSVLLLLALLSLFSWMGLSDYVRAEFLKGRNMEYVKAAKALGVSNITIMYRHLLPNGMTPVITFLPFRMSASILALTSLDFLGLGVPPSTPSLGELLAQGKANIDAWWLSLSTFTVLVGTLVLLIFIGEALRETFDPRKT
jgi:microcin C transport system permease protein